MAGGEISDDCYDFYPKPLESQTISITLEDLETRLGYKVNFSQFVKWMRALKCDILKSEKAALTLKPPSFRSDLSIKEDLIEELARLEGYDLIPETLPQKILKEETNIEFSQIQKIQNLARNEGCSEVIHYSFSDPDLYKEFLKDKEELTSIGLKPREAFLIKNPISQNLSLMKNFLSPDMFKTIDRNFRHGNKWGQIFEIAPVFHKDKNQYQQSNHWALAKWGHHTHLWNREKIPNVFYLKSVLENLLNRLNYQGVRWKQVSSKVSFLHPEQTLLLQLQNKTVGYVGTLHPFLQSKYKIPVDVALAELDLEEVLTSSKNKFKVQNISSFSTLEKDLSFVIPSDQAVMAVQKEIKKVLGSSCEKVEVFDLYEKDKNRSVSFRLYLTPLKQAWTDQDLQDFQNKVIEHISKKFDIHLK